LRDAHQRIAIGASSDPARFDTTEPLLVYRSPCLRSSLGKYGVPHGAPYHVDLVPFGHRHSRIRRRRLHLRRASGPTAREHSVFSDPARPKACGGYASSETLSGVAAARSRGSGWERARRAWVQAMPITSRRRAISPRTGSPLPQIPAPTHAEHGHSGPGPDTGGLR
jgi:hypothetical protein